MAYRLIKDFAYPLGEVFGGDAVLSIFEFATPAGVLAQPIANKMIDEFESQCLDEGVSALRLKVWCDSAPVFQTKYYCEFTCCTAEEVAEGQIAYVPVWLIPLMPKIIAGVIAVIIVLLIYLSIREVRKIFYSPAGPTLAGALKWLAIGLSVVAGGYLVSQIIKLRAKA